MHAETSKHPYVKQSKQIYKLNSKYSVEYQKLPILIIKYMFIALKLAHNFSIKAYNVAKNYYKILNIPESANKTDIKKAFRQLAKQYHPDSAKGKEQLFKEVNQAYQVLSDDSIRKEYDQVRAASSPKQSSYQGSSTYHPNPSQEAYRQQQSQNQYRGYQAQQGWNNKSFREQFLNDLYRQQQNEYMRSQYQQTKREEMQRVFRQKMRETVNRDINDTIRQYNQAAKSKQAEARRRFEQDEKRRRDQEYEEYRRYKDQSYSDNGEKMRQNLNRMADGIASNVKDTMKMVQELKKWWLKFKENNKK